MHDVELVETYLAPSRVSKTTRDLRTLMYLSIVYSTVYWSLISDSFFHVALAPFNTHFHTKFGVGLTKVFVGSSGFSSGKIVMSPV